MNKRDLETIAKVANAIPKMMKLSRHVFEAVICSSIDTYASVHELEREDVFAGVGVMFMSAEIEEVDDEEDDNDKE